MGNAAKGDNPEQIASKIKTKRKVPKIIMFLLNFIYSKPLYPIISPASVKTPSTSKIIIFIFLSF